MSNEMSDLDGIVMQNKLRVSYGFIGEQGHPRAIGKYDTPSVWAFQSCSLHGTGTLRYPKFLRSSGDQQDSKNCGNEAAADINLIECPLVEEARQWERQSLRRSCSPHSWVRFFA